MLLNYNKLTDEYFMFSGVQYIMQPKKFIIRKSLSGGTGNRYNEKIVTLYKELIAIDWRD